MAATHKETAAAAEQTLAAYTRYHAFISHGSFSKSVALALRGEIERTHRTAFVDCLDGMSETIRSVADIEAKVDASDIVIIIVDYPLLASGWACAEVNRAQKTGKTVWPIFIGSGVRDFLKRCTGDTRATALARARAQVKIVTAKLATDAAACDEQGELLHKRWTDRRPIDNRDVPLTDEQWLEDRANRLADVAALGFVGGSTRMSNDGTDEAAFATKVIRDMIKTKKFSKVRRTPAPPDVILGEDGTLLVDALTAPTGPAAVLLDGGGHTDASVLKKTMGDVLLSSRIKAKFAPPVQIDVAVTGSDPNNTLRDVYNSDIGGPDDSKLDAHESAQTVRSAIVKGLAERTAVRQHVLLVLHNAPSADFVNAFLPLFHRPHAVLISTTSSSFAHLGPDVVVVPAGSAVADSDLGLWRRGPRLAPRTKPVVVVYGSGSRKAAKQLIAAPAFKGIPSIKTAIVLPMLEAVVDDTGILNDDVDQAEIVIFVNVVESNNFRLLLAQLVGNEYPQNKLVIEYRSTLKKQQDAGGCLLTQGISVDLPRGVLDTIPVVVTEGDLADIILWLHDRSSPPISLNTAPSLLTLLVMRLFLTTIGTSHDHNERRWIEGRYPDADPLDGSLGSIVARVTTALGTAFAVKNNNGNQDHFVTVGTFDLDFDEYLAQSTEIPADGFHLLSVAPDDLHLVVERSPADWSRVLGLVSARDGVFAKWIVVDVALVMARGTYFAVERRRAGLPAGFVDPLPGPVGSSFGSSLDVLAPEPGWLATTFGDAIFDGHKLPPHLPLWPKQVFADQLLASRRDALPEVTKKMSVTVRTARLTNDAQTGDPPLVGAQVAWINAGGHNAARFLAADAMALDASSFVDLCDTRLLADHAVLGVVPVTLCPATDAVTAFADSVCTIIANATANWATFRVLGKLSSEFFPPVGPSWSAADLVSHMASVARLYFVVDASATSAADLDALIAIFRRPESMACLIVVTDAGVPHSVDLNPFVAPLSSNARGLARDLADIATAIGAEDSFDAGNLVAALDDAGVATVAASPLHLAHALVAAAAMGIDHATLAAAATTDHPLANVVVAAFRACNASAAYWLLEVLTLWPTSSLTSTAVEYVLSHCLIAPVAPKWLVHVLFVNDNAASLATVNLLAAAKDRVPAQHSNPKVAQSVALRTAMDILCRENESIASTLATQHDQVIKAQLSAMGDALKAAMIAVQEKFAELLEWALCHAPLFAVAQAVTAASAAASVEAVTDVVKFFRSALAAVRQWAPDASHIAQTVWACSNAAQAMRYSAKDDPGVLDALEAVVTGGVCHEPMSLMGRTRSDTARLCAVALPRAFGVPQGAIVAVEHAWSLAGEASEVRVVVATASGYLVEVSGDGRIVRSWRADVTIDQFVGRVCELEGNKKVVEYVCAADGKSQFVVGRWHVGATDADLPGPQSTDAVVRRTSTLDVWDARRVAKRGSVDKVAVVPDSEHNSLGFAVLLNAGGKSMRVGFDSGGVVCVREHAIKQFAIESRDSVALIGDGRPAEEGTGELLSAEVTVYGELPQSERGLVVGAYTFSARAGSSEPVVLTSRFAAPMVAPELEDGASAGGSASASRRGGGDRDGAQKSDATLIDELFADTLFVNYRLVDNTTHGAIVAMESFSFPSAGVDFVVAGTAVGGVMVIIYDAEEGAVDQQWLLPPLGERASETDDTLVYRTSLVSMTACELGDGRAGARVFASLSVDGTDESAAEIEFEWDRERREVVGGVWERAPGIAPAMIRAAQNHSSAVATGAARTADGSVVCGAAADGTVWIEVWKRGGEIGVCGEVAGTSVLATVAGVGVEVDRDVVRVKLTARDGMPPVEWVVPASELPVELDGVASDVATCDGYRTHQTFACAQCQGAFDVVSDRLMISTPPVVAFGVFDGGWLAIDGRDGFPRFFLHHCRAA